MIVYIKFYFYESVREKNVENISKKNQISQTGKKSQNPKKNCRDFLIPRIFVRFVQNKLSLVLSREAPPPQLARQQFWEKKH